MAPKSNLIDQLSAVLLCKPSELYVKLLEPKIREQANAFLKLVNLETTHLRFNKPVKFSGLTYTGARELMAFRGFLQITVAQYYYAKHRIILTYIDHPCIIQMPTCSNSYRGGSDHLEYFPLEVLRVVPAGEKEIEFDDSV